MRLKSRRRWHRGPKPSGGGLRAAPIDEDEAKVRGGRRDQNRGGGGTEGRNRAEAGSARNWSTRMRLRYVVLDEIGIEVEAAQRDETKRRWAPCGVGVEAEAEVRDGRKSHG
jgi:hypothetical protein